MSLRKTALLTALCGLLGSPLAWAAPDVNPIGARISALFSEWASPESPGAAVAVTRGGSVLYEGAFGTANLEYGVPIISETVFHVASVSKQFTAFAILLLEQKGELGLDDDIRRYLPEIHDFGETITIRHLVHHLSGLRDQWVLWELSGYRLDDVITSRNILRLIERQRELNFSPGEEISYSNTGYTLLAEIVARVTGRSFAEFMQESVFRPLGMKATHFHEDHQHIVKNRAYPYVLQDDTRLAKGVLSYALTGNTSLLTTISDMERWIRNFSTGEVGGEAVVEKMLETGLLNSGEDSTYAFGLGVTDFRGLRYALHSGYDAGYTSYLGYFPDQDLGIVILSNYAGVDGMSLGRQVAEIVLAEHLEDEVSSEHETDPEPDAATEDRVFRVERPLSDYVGAYYSPELRTVYEIEIREGSLVAVHSRKRDVPFSPISDDAFEGDQWWFWKADFSRDEDGRVDELLVSTSSVRKARFTRLESHQLR